MFDTSRRRIHCATLLVACSWLALTACDAKTQAVSGNGEVSETDDSTGQVDTSSQAVQSRSTSGVNAPSMGISPTAATSETSGAAPASARCADPSLTWRSGHKTNYESYPDPGSEECIEFNGCYWAGMFAGCNDKMPKEWVQAHNIVAVFPHFEELALHDLCLRRGNDMIVVTAYDTCGDDDCDGCCTENRGSADALIDLEKYTNERWGLDDGDIEWADLGPTLGDGCN